MPCKPKLNKEVQPYPLDVLDAETEGAIGYLIEQELRNQLPEQPIVTLLTQIEVDPRDRAFTCPTNLLVRFILRRRLNS